MLGVIDRDPRGAAQLAEGQPNWRSPLLRSAAAVTAALISHLPPLTADDRHQLTTPANAMVVPDVDPLGGRQWP
jgi:hypothetical protein